MKKYFLVVLCALLLFVVTGCGSKNELRCTQSMNESGIKMDGEIIAEFDKDDKLVDATVVYDLGDKDTATSWCAMFKMTENKDKGITVDCSGSKITMTGYAKAVEEESEDGEKILGKTKEEFKKYAEAEGMTCK